MPAGAAFLKPWLSELVAGLLFFAALRIGPRQAFGGFSEIRTSLLLTTLFQFVLPITMLGVLALLGLLDHPIALPIVLLLAAPAVSSSPSLTQMTGHNPAPALRLMILGTVLLPLTALVPFWLLPTLGPLSEAVFATARLLIVIIIAVSLAFVLRGLFLPKPTETNLKAIDGLNAIVMRVVIVGLMSAVSPAINNTPFIFFYWLAIAFVVNYGLQFVAYAILGKTALKNDRAGYSIIAGNRNISLFLVALEPQLADDLLLFIGCYQVPMFLVPIFLRKFYKKNN